MAKRVPATTCDGVRCIDLVSPSLLCRGCGYLLKEAVQSLDGYRYCAPCFEKETGLPDIPHSRACYFSRVSETVTYLPDLCAQKEVDNLKFACKSANQECDWQGELRDHADHFASCPFSLVTCDLPGCTASVQRRHLAEHKVTECEGRHVACEHCGDDVIASRMSHHVAVDCQRVTVPCPNTCKATDLVRAEVASHLKDCPRQNVRCYYASADCEFHDKRQALQPHHDNNVAYHMQLTFQVAANAKKALNELRQTCSVLEAENTRLSNRVSELEANTAQEVTELKGNNAHLSDSLSELGQAFKELNALVLGQIPALVNSHTDGSRYSEVDSRDAVSGMAASARVSTAAALSPSPLRPRLTTRATGGVQDSARVSDLSTRQNRLEVQMSDLELRQDLMEVQGSDGVLIWRISDIRRQVAEAESGRKPCLYAPPFYSSGGTTGYKMCARIYLNGDGAGKDTHISLFFVVMRGDFDALMPWPFQQMVKLSLLDQSVDEEPDHIVDTFQPDFTSSSFQRPTTDMNIATGCPRFAPKSCLLSDRYVKDDSLFLRADVPVLGPRHHLQETER